MKHLFAKDQVGVMAQLAWTNFLLAFDYDGTLAPIVDDRDRAYMRPDTAMLLRQVSRRYPTAVVSGRAKADVGARVRGLGVKYVVGNHGLEPGAAADLVEFERQVGQARVLLEQRLEGVAGVDVEDKRYSLALHYRRARVKSATRQALHEAIDDLPMPMRIVPGKQVVNVIPAGAPHKGDAVLELRAAHRADTVLYVGDDDTDEDVFALDQPGRLMTVRVGASRHSQATYFLRDQAEIDVLLACLVHLR